MKVFFRILFTNFILFLFPLINIYSQSLTTVYFYGVASKYADKNMLEMTEELYFKQLSELNINLIDKRSDNFSENYLQSNSLTSSEEEIGLTLYVVIIKKDSGKWECQIHAEDKAKQDFQTLTKEYDSYYKILMESKTSLKTIFTKLLETFNSTENKNEPFIQQSTSVTTENIAGTWSGEDSINKIVIMRGGRGFIIFKNGASMNISVNLNQSENKIKIKQTSNNNASYYPNLDRQIALEYAIKAKPIEWNLVLTDENTLKGTKKTLIQQDTKAVESTVDITWNKIN